MSEPSRIIEFAEELRRNGEFTYLALSVVAQGLQLSYQFCLLIVNYCRQMVVNL